MSHLNKKLLGAGATAVALSAFVPNPFMIGEALAQATAQDTMNITAKVVNPLDISQVTKFNFGSFAVSAVAGKLTVPVGGAQVITNGVFIAGDVTGKVQFTAPKSASFTIEVAALNANSIILKNGTGGTSKKTMKVDQLFLKGTSKIKISGAVSGAATFVAAGNTDATAKITDAGGVAVANIGGRLNFKPTQVVGSYTGTYTMLITF